MFVKCFAISAVSGKQGFVLWYLGEWILQDETLYFYVSGGFLIHIKIYCDRLKIILCIRRVCRTAVGSACDEPCCGRRFKNRKDYMLRSVLMMLKEEN